MNYAQKFDLFFPFFNKVVVTKSKAYCLLIIGMMHLQKILLSVRMLQFHFFSLICRALEYINTTEVFMREYSLVTRTSLKDRQRKTGKAHD